MDRGADLEEPVLAAWRLLGRGFAEAADGDPSDDDSLAALEERSTVLVLRLLVAFVAHSRGLTVRAGDDAMAADGDGNAVSAAEAVVSLEELRIESRGERDAADGGFADAADERSTAIWRRLEALFRLLDDGDESLGVPPYDGELFDTANDDLSTDDAVADRYLAAAIHRLSTIETDDGRTEPVDFAAVETCQLGSAYETLLDHRFRIGSAGELVVVDDDERKTTGTYYTPQDVVDYVVEETVGPLVDGIEDDLESDGLEPGTGEYLTALHRRVTALRILDPAMGSGRFLARTLDFLVARVLDAAHETGEETALGEPRVRHDIAASCLYGVDRDELAVELATASLWLETLATGQPLTGLDQHLEVGNALVGSDASTARSGVIAARCDESPSLGRRIELANVRTASRFGLELPDDALERLAHAIDDDEAWADLRATDWFRAARSMSNERGFFHWDLEFPEVFLDERGRPQPDAGFDAVLGNPPWVATAGRADISASMDRSLRAYLEERYTATRQQFDLYVAFCERFVRLAAAGRIGIVVPDAILAREQNVHLRRYLLDTTCLTTLLHLGTAFEGVENGAAVVVTGADEGKTKCAALEGEATVRTVDYAEIPQSAFREQDACRFLVHLDRHVRSVLRKLDRFSSLGERVDISRGEEISKRAEFLAETDDRGGLRAIVPGSAVVPYGFDDTETRYVPADEIEKDLRNYRSPKLVFRQTASKPIGALDSNDRITIKSAYNIRTDGSEADLRRLLGVLNSSLLEYYHEVTHAAYRTVFPQINQATFESYPIAVPDAPEFDDLVAERISLTRERRGLTVDLRTQLGRYRDGDSLSEIGTCDSVAPPDSTLRTTGDELAGLRLGRASVDCVAPDTVRIDATARYKPADGDRETDRWGYTETDPTPALRLSDLTKTEGDLLEAFVPVAVDEAGGFAGVRETATKTISLLDRLRALTVPVVDDVRDGLERYRETKTDAAELETRIEAIDRRIDELVYDCYGLTATEIETVEATLDDG
ncbi:N-6 DNA methylase [Natrinema sp. 1APR25-10V2]|uniref:Eco57I restriction-modification methylase domain-containing protein n=1 Tax=Natrinema sp. 1APR25-10V2 TaxID=2951081 RepID=UPI00287652B8|nr:N-6 DNA methylase [Natrinema sp. 1APR25-10V2]MDS0477848.1 N-6 DNA methylase [Natrinema sp. 1APR25-10V2]